MDQHCALLLSVNVCCECVSASHTLSPPPFLTCSSHCPCFNSNLHPHHCASCFQPPISLNQVIFGIPMLESLYGPKVKILNVLAAISSVIYQLPIMLMFFEYREVTKAQAAKRGRQLQGHNALPLTDAAQPKQQQQQQATPEPASVPSHAGNATTETTDPSGGVDGDADVSGFPDTQRTDSYRVAIEHQNSMDSIENSNSNSNTQDNQATSTTTLTSHAGAAVADNKATHPTTTTTASTAATDDSRVSVDGNVLVVVLKRVAPKLLRNHPFVGICIGLLWSLILRMAADENEFPKVIDTFVQYFADCVTPVASFCTGMFMCGHERDVLRMWKPLLLFLLAKMIVMPALAMLVCVIVDLDGIEARSAVLLASLPVALASFTLVTTYMKERPSAMSLISGLIIVGSVLMPFAFAAWNEILIAGDVFGDIPSGAVYTG